MDANTILANPNIIRLESFISEPNAITIIIHSKQKRPCCPNCNESSSSLHSHYQRTISDLPWHNVAVKLRLNTRRLRCRNELCGQKIFCERLPDVVGTYARKSYRLDGALTWLAFALGGEAGARTAERLRMKTSGDTLLRMIRRSARKRALSPAGNEPKVIGVDDWAWRKGCTYGTIIVDLERRKVIDLLPDREAATLTDWLVARPSVETVARDRSITYRNSIMMGRPYATQIADRWHLLSNLGDVMEKLIERLLRKRKTAAGQTTEPNNHNQGSSRQRADFKEMEDWQWEHSLKKSFEQMKRNACRLRLLPHLPLLPKIQAASGQAAATHHKSADHRRSQSKLNAKSLRSLCFGKGRLSEDELEMLCDARAEWDEFDGAFPLAEEFVKIIRGQSSMSIGLWIVKAFDSGVKELRSFANGLQKDFLAVREATVSPWSNGQTEGQVNRLKLLKRQMYGRAKFDLLKARVLNPA
jgi:transposase